MIKNSIIIPVDVRGKKIELKIVGQSSLDLVLFVEDAFENGESQYQIFEGCFYEYSLPKEYKLDQSELVNQSRINISSGYITPNIYVGTLRIDVLDYNDNVIGEVKIEVQSKKTDYREEYKHMLVEIAEISSDLILSSKSPISQNFEINFTSDTKILYQRFAFINSILNSRDFEDSIHKIVSSPVTRWKENIISKDIRKIKRINNSNLKGFCSAKNRTRLEQVHPLFNIINSIPSRIQSTHKVESVDTPENRFIKYALRIFQTICSEIKDKANDNHRLNREATIQVEKLENILNYSIFKEVNELDSIPLNSPVLQKKEGYREILRIWFMFELSSKLNWHGGNDVYNANKKDVATLYEYWLFFKLLDVFRSIFTLDSRSLSELIKASDDGLGLQLVQGYHTSIKGTYSTEKRKLNIEFSFNRTFSGDSPYPLSGSWTRSMRPDYTLSIWPFGISSEEAESEELIVHIHFDAKYKVQYVKDIFGSDDDLFLEKIDQRKGTFKRSDLLKMHSYKDAIRRTAGSYILYPGNDASYIKFGFHEIIPGLGAFAICPSKSDSGIQQLVHFIHDVLKNFMNRASHRERLSYKTYEVFKNRNSTGLYKVLPETIGENRDLIPDDTYVLIGYFKNIDHLNWINTNLIYNTRTGNNNGSLSLGIGEVSAKYLLLYTKGEEKSSRLYKIESKGPRIFSKNELVKLKYPNPMRDFYLVYNISQNTEQEFKNTEWHIGNMQKIKENQRGLPFCVTLSDFMKHSKIQ